MAIAFSLSLAVTAFAAPITTEVEPPNSENTILINVTDPDAMELLAAELLPPERTIRPYGYIYVGCNGMANECFTSQPGTSCIFKFYSRNADLAVSIRTIGDYPKTCYCYKTLTSIGTYEYYCTWVSDTATPFRMFIENTSPIEADITGLVISY